MSDVFSGLDDLIKAIGSFECEVAQTFLMTAFKHLNWNPKFKNTDEGYVITINVPSKCVYEYSDNECSYPVVMYSVFDSPYCYYISSILPVDDLPEDFIDCALTIAKELAEKILGDEKNYRILSERNRIRVEYVLQLDPFGKDDDSLELYEALGVEEVCELVRKQAIMEYFYVEGLNKAFEKLLDTNGHLKVENDGTNQSQENVSENKIHSRRVLGVAALIGLVVLVFVALLNIFIIPNGKYNDAIELMNEGEYQEAIFIFETIVDYKDSKETIKECHYELGQACVEKGEFRRALTEFSKAQDFKDSKIQYAKILSEISAKDTISTYMNHIVGLKRDGTVIAVGFNEYGACDVQEWTNIESVAAGIWHTIGLKSDGSVVSTGLNENGECNVFFWTDIVSVCAGESHTVGLKSDGTVVATGWNGNGACDVDGWMDIVAISAGRGHTVGLKSDGTVVAVGTNRYGECDVSSWSDIVAISTSANHTVGLKSDGSVVAVGSNMEGACGVDGWTNIVAISAGRGHTVGLKSDGTVVATRYTGDESYYGRCDVENWKGVVAISAGERHTVGLKSDGTIVVAGDLMSNEDFTRFNGIRIPELN